MSEDTRKALLLAAGAFLVAFALVLVVQRGRPTTPALDWLEIDEYRAKRDLFQRWLSEHGKEGAE